MEAFTNLTAGAVPMDLPNTTLARAPRRRWMRRSSTAPKPRLRASATGANQNFAD